MSTNKKVIEKLCSSKRKSKYSNDYYLKLILLALNDVNSWRSIRKSIYYKNGELAKYGNDANYESKIEKDNHWKTIYDKHIQWGEAGVYKQAYAELIKIKCNNVNGEDGNAEFKLLIDGTNNLNKYMVSILLDMDMKLRRKSSRVQSSSKM